MEIVIENPTTQGALKSPEYFASIGNNQRLLNGAEVDASTPKRRVDRSGLLEMPQAQVQSKPQPQPSEITSLRRIDRSGLLESVSEIPDHVAYAKSRLLEHKTQERYLTGAEITKEDGPSSLTLPRLRSRERRGSYDLAQSREFKETGCFGGLDNTGNGVNHVEQMVARFSPSRKPVTPPEIKGERLKTKPDGATIGRLSPRPRNDHRISSPAALSIPDVIEAHEPPSGNGVNLRINSTDDESSPPGPEGERAEAEGCEHTAIESLEEARVSFKAPKKIIHNDNIQTLRVIILSEQL